jgi:glucose uptake protein GlcU
MVLVKNVGWLVSGFQVPGMRRILPKSRGLLVDSIIFHYRGDHNEYNDLSKENVVVRMMVQARVVSRSNGS